MAKAPAELSSISSTLEELTNRISKLADQLSNEGDSDVAYELFEVERSLTPGLRRLSRLVNRR
jgi:hypothetical protein